MAKLEYTDIKPRKIFKMDDCYYEVISSAFAKKNRAKGTNQTRIKNLKTGDVIAKTFHASDTVEQAECERKKIQFVYSRGSEIIFCDPENTSKRFSVPTEQVSSVEFLYEKMILDALYTDETLLRVDAPVKVELTVKDTPMGERGNTAQGGTKAATLENGSIIQVPLFVNNADKIVINTETGKYVERVKTKNF